MTDSNKERGNEKSREYPVGAFYSGLGGYLLAVGTAQSHGQSIIGY